MASRDSGAVSVKEVPRYDAKPSSYDMWSRHFRAAMEEMGRWEVFDESLPLPAEERTLHRWNKKDSKAFAVLTRALGTEDYNIIEHLRGTFGSAKQAWDLIRARKHISGHAAKTQMLARVTTNYMRSGETIQAYLSRCSKLWRENLLLQAGVLEDVFLDAVVTGLSEDWELVQLDLQRQAATWTREKVWNALITESDRRTVNAQLRASRGQVARLDMGMLAETWGDGLEVPGKAEKQPKTSKGPKDAPKNAPKLITNGTQEEKLSSALQVMEYYKGRSDRQHEQLGNIQRKNRDAAQGGRNRGRGTRPWRRSWQ